MKRIVLFVEGEGESDAAPRLVKRLLTEQNAWDAVFLDEHPFRVGEINNLVKERLLKGIWKRPRTMPRGGFVVSWMAATNRPEIRRHLPIWLISKPSGLETFDHSRGWSRLCRH